MLKFIIFCTLTILANCDQRTGRIFGGQDAAAGQFPYQVSLFLLKENGHTCGGSIIREHWVLSAAHCTLLQPQDYRILAGSVLIRGDPNQVQRDVMRIINHPNYDRYLIYDISVLRVTQPFVYTVNVQPIKLGTQFIGTRVPAVAAGWGTGRTSNILQYINTTTISNDECALRLSFFPRLSHNCLCTLSPVGQGICSHDSGGVLVSNGLQIGVVNWGIDCGVGLPAMFARVSNFISWINANAVD